MAERLTGQRVERLRRRSKYILADLVLGRDLADPPRHVGADAGLGRDAGAVPPRPSRAREARPCGPARWRAARGSPSTTRAASARWTCGDRSGRGASAAGEPWPRTAGQRLRRSLISSSRLKGRDTPIKSALLDQQIVAGLGNIYVCEVLHRAGISPRRRAGNLGTARVARLVPLIREVLSEAIEAGGSSLRDYRQTDGELGILPAHLPRL